VLVVSFPAAGLAFFFLQNGKVCQTALLKLTLQRWTRTLNARKRRKDKERQTKDAAHRQKAAAAKEQASKPARPLTRYEQSVVRAMNGQQPQKLPYWHAQWQRTVDAAKKPPKEEEEEEEEKEEEEEEA